MKNKINLKRCIWQCLFVTLIFLAAVIVLNVREYREYLSNYNQKIDAILREVQKTYPAVTKKELMDILESTDTKETKRPEDSFLSGFGIDMEKDSVILANETDFRRSMAGNIVLAVLFACALAGLFLKYNHSKDKELAQITRYIEELNRRNYKLEMDDMSEDELSILKNEIYKTTVMLKETAENSVQAKNELKDSLSDISHQLKTPLTSILVILDNLIDDPEMDKRVRADFIRDIKREITNIQFLVQSLLKLSKLDSNTVVFFREEVCVEQMIEVSIQNVAMLCDLKTVAIETDFLAKDAIVCDFRWQVEALTNILKNCVEHSPCGGRIEIKTEQNNVYTTVSIRDFGEGMDEEDQKHIFERFYKGKNATHDSVGIGLSLAKAIVEADRGHISVESGKDGTKFVVKYFCF